MRNTNIKRKESNNLILNFFIKLLNPKRKKHPRPKKIKDGYGKTINNSTNIMQRKKNSVKAETEIIQKAMASTNDLKIEEV